MALTAIFDRSYGSVAEDADGVSIDSDYNQPFRRLYIGNVSGGTAVKIQTARGNDVTYKVAAGTRLEIQGRKVYLTGTTAADILAED